MATQTVIENPVINSPFDEPKRHFKFSDEGITNEIIEGRRVSSYFIPIAAPKKKGEKQLYFDTEYRERFPGRDVDSLTDEDLLREVMNTVGKSGKLGEQIKCVVSVSMLTEGWDANTVTHVLGVRAFGTQLLCEQVVGRARAKRKNAIKTMMTLRQLATRTHGESGRDVAQPSPAASSSTVPVRESVGNGASPELAAGTSALQDASGPLVSGFHFRGVLPHLKKEGGTYFVTFREADTLPKEVLLRFKREREAILQQALAAKRPLTWHEQEELFRWYSNRVDKYLDASHGECHLRCPEFADLVAGAICFFERQRYELRAWVVMPNHAHVVVWPMPGHALSDILHSWKSYTAHEINKHLPKKIVPFWQSESYEHLIRDDDELQRCCYYTLMNPVNARLCARPEDWRWSSAHVAQSAGDVVQPSPAASSSTVPVRETGARDTPPKDSGGGTPPKLAGGDACATATLP